MTDLNERLKGIDRLTPPDLWEAAQIKAEGGLTSPSTPSLTRRLAIIAASLAIGLAAVGLVMIAFRSDPSASRPVTPGRHAVENGDIWVKVGGGDGETAIYRVDPQSVRNPEAMWTDSGGTFGDTPVAPELLADDYAFSPDGSQVAFSAQEDQGSGEVPRELFVMNADGTGLRRLTSDRAYAGFPDWSPDGDTIAYASYRGTNYVPGCLGSSICPTDLYVIDVTGGTPSLLVAGDVSETTPSWSPDGSSIAFAEIGEDGVGAIVTTRADGSGRVELAPTGAVSFPSWSPDGTQILFLKMQDGTNHLWTVNPDGSGHHDLADTRTDTNFGRPLWSPEGDYIAFARPYAGVVSLWIIDPAGDRSPERIAGWPGFAGSPIAWRPIPAETMPSASDVTALVSSSGPSGDTALLTGTLTAENGCLAVSTVYVVWPAGYSLSEEKAGIWLVDDSGTLVARIGDEVQMGGGITNLAHAEPEVVGGIPSSCEVGSPDAYWFAGTPEAVIGSLVANGAADMEATRLPGIDAYRVCRVLALPGDFGDAGDEVVVFEEERVPGAGCIGSEGFQHVAVLRDGRVTSLSRRITDFDIKAWRVWPYATPDLDGDGEDEIAVALSDGGEDRRVWFFMLAPGGGGVEAVYDPQQPFTHVIGGDAAPLPRGIYCDGEGKARRIVTWVATGAGKLDVIETRWRLETFRVVFDSETTVHIEKRGYPDAGDVELCGSPVSLRRAYPSA